MTRLTMIDPVTESAAKATLDAVNRKLGVVPNMMRALAVNPAILDAYLAFSGAVTHARASASRCTSRSRSPSPKPMVATTASPPIPRSAAAPDCRSPPCFPPARARPTTPARRRRLTFARRLVAERGAVSQDELAEARTALTDAEIVETVASVALNVFTNYLNLSADTDIDFPRAASLRQAA